ncbi:olfactory receptor 6F1-like [Spea bombifrons]|uniref:olfactory receptor 6F1-like n=1 Tax=Spea bombifrons TaxID=233779 RepID=UPI00234B53F1|nr:olfactory receptor 6F1-like [Spea bombifrons]
MHKGPNPLKIIQSLEFQSIRLISVLEKVMFGRNKTRVTEFMLLGFQNPQVSNSVLFVFFLVVYILTLAGNLLIIILVSKFQSLNSPMYFFLSQLSICDILHTTNIIPKMLSVIINGGSSILVTSCIAQLYFYGVSTGSECLLLTVMSYDRYLAICKPLHYKSIMSFTLQLHLAIWCWVFPLLAMAFLGFLICNLHFCGPQIIDHYFCDFGPLLELSCSDTTIVELSDFVIGIPFTILPFFFIFFSYIFIFTTIFGKSSTSGKQKFFSTCSSHLTIVSIYYGTLITVYMVSSKGQSFNVKKVMSLLCNSGTPFFNPIIYSFRNQEIKLALIKCVRST